MRKIIFALLIGCTCVVSAEEVAPRNARTVLSDGVYLASSPTRLRSQDLPVAVGVVGSIAGLSLLDRTVRNHLAPWSQSSSAKSLRRFGDFGQMAGPIIGTGFALHGWLGDDDKSKQTAFLAYETFLWAGAAEAVLKGAVGRSRPSVTTNPFHFKPGLSNSSFPSGHTTTAFAAATVFAQQYPHWYVVGPAYGAAALTGYSRLAADQHWLSDVAGAAVLGTLVSRALWARRRHPENYSWDVETSGSDIKLVRRF